MYLELDQVPPVLEPLSEDGRVIALHDLEARLQVVAHPAVHIGEAIRQAPTFLGQALIHGCGIPVSKPLDDHEGVQRVYSELMR